MYALKKTGTHTLEPMNTTNEKPDYQIAKKELEALYLSLELAYSVSKPKGEVREGWPCISYECTFAEGRVTQTIEYRLGVGHVKWNCMPFKIQYKDGYVYANVFDAIKGKQEVKKDYRPIVAEIAAALAQEQKVSPSHSEVLGNVCRDGLDAIGQTFEEWANNYGYDADSRKAEATYQACIKAYQQALSLMEHKNIEKMAELANQL